MRRSEHIGADASRSAAVRLKHFLTEPPRWLEISLWALLVVLIVGTRVYVVHLVPVHLWSKDAGSYTGPVFKWLETGAWQTDPRRGPVYSLVIAGCLKLWRSFDAVMLLQHVLSACAVLLAIVVLRLLHSRRAIIPIFLCGYSYAVYAAPIHMSQLIRNETLLFVFSTIAFTGWYLTMRANPAGVRWLWVAGLAAGLLTLTKNVFIPFPLIVVASILWLNRARPAAAAARAAVFAFAFVLPFLGAHLLQRATVDEKPSTPQSGLLLFGRVAQFTVLDRGIEPEIKQLIRQDIEAYRALIVQKGELDNNVPLNDTAVPRMRAFYQKLGRTPTELNQLCRALALEAIAAHPMEYALQMLNDLRRLQLKGANVRAPGANDMIATRKLVERARGRQELHVPDTIAVLREREDPQHFRWYKRLVTSAWMFILPPGLLTSISVTALALFTRGKMRLWWLALAGVWWFTMALLSTVASPLDRYLIPVTPVMFWSMSTAVVLGWNRLISRFRPNERCPVAAALP